MSAYVISEVRIIRYIARAAVPDAPEGDWDDSRRMVIVEFPTMAKLRAWYASDDYADALAIRKSALDRRLLFVPGLED